MGRLAALAGDYSYLLNFIEGGAERLAGEADAISGVVADDEAMTLDRHAFDAVGTSLPLPDSKLFFPCLRLPSVPARTTRTS